MKIKDKFMASKIFITKKDEVNLMYKSKRISTTDKPFRHFK